MTSEADRTPPQDVDAEQAVLGAMLMSTDAIATVVGILNASDFYKPAHEVIFAGILTLFSRGDAADAITIAAHLTTIGEISRCGGHGYIHDLLASVSIAANATHYAHIVRDKAILRRMVDAGGRVQQLGYAETGDVDELLNTAQEILFDAGTTHNDALTPIANLMQPVWDDMDALSTREGRLTGIPTGITILDDMCDGLQPGQMIIVAGRPAMGKSNLALTIARHAAITHQQCTAMFCLEMSEKEIMKRILAAEAAIPFHNLATGDLDNRYWTTLGSTSKRILDAPLFIDDSTDQTILGIRAKARRFKQQHDLRLVVIDYVNLLSSPTGRRYETRQVEVSEYSRQIKLMAKELDIPVIALCQLNRGPEARADKKPQLSDLKESGSLEQDADMVILIHRPDYYDKTDRPGEADIHLAKHRNGPTNTINVIYQGQYHRFTNNPDLTKAVTP
jgi:replicative DNA helicase